MNQNCSNYDSTSGACTMIRLDERSLPCLKLVYLSLTNVSKMEESRRVYINIGEMMQLQESNLTHQSCLLEEETRHGSSTHIIKISKEDSNTSSLKLRGVRYYVHSSKDTYDIWLSILNRKLLGRNGRRHRCWNTLRTCLIQVSYNCPIC